MSNIIRVSELSPNSEWLVMSNQGTVWLNGRTDETRQGLTSSNLSGYR